MIDLDEFVGGYLDGILFTERVDDSGEDDTSMLSWGHTREDFNVGTLAAIRGECAGFIEANRADLERYSELMGGWHGGPDSFGRTEYSASECAGTDFWFSRNGHGAGYFDRGADPVFGRLQVAARVYGEAYLYSDGETISA